MLINTVQRFCSFFCIIGDDKEDEITEAISMLPSITHKAVRHKHGLVSLVISIPESNPLFKYHLHCDKEIIVFVQGDFYEPFESSFDKDIFFNNTIDVKNVEKIVSRLNGVFCGFIANIKTGCVYAFTDMFGFGMMYTCKSSGKVMLASSIWPLITNKGWRGSINSLAAKEILLFGFPHGNLTVYENINVVRPATITRVDRKENEICFRNIDRKPNSTNERDVILSMLDAMQKHFNDVSNINSVGKFGLALSGGHDSRVVLNGMLNSGITPECFIGHRGRLSTDARNAVYTARLAKCEYTVFDYAELGEQESIDNNILLDGAETGNWSMALAREAAGHSNEIIYFGTSGDFMSGGWRFDPLSYRNWRELAAAGLKADYEYGFPIEEYCTIFKHEKGGDVIESYINSYDKSEKDIRDVFLSQRLDEKNFRRIRTFMRGGYLYSSPAHLFHDRRVAGVYLNMPYSLLRKQKAHIKMCSTGNFLQGIIPATNYPVPVLMEPFLIPVIKKLLPKQYIAKYKNRFVKKNPGAIPQAGAQALNIIAMYVNRVNLDIDKLIEILEFDSRSQLISLRVRYLANMLEPDELCLQSTILGITKITDVPAITE